jgi:hypothetical protein
MIGKVGKDSDTADSKTIVDHGPCPFIEDQEVMVFSYAVKPKGDWYYAVVRKVARFGHRWRIFMCDVMGCFTIDCVRPHDRGIQLPPLPGLPHVERATDMVEVWNARTRTLAYYTPDDIRRGGHYPDDAVPPQYR